MSTLENSALQALYTRVEAATPTFSHEYDPRPGDRYIGEATAVMGKMCAVRQEIKDQRSFSNPPQIRRLSSSLEESFNHLLVVEIRTKMDCADVTGKLKVRSDGKVYEEGQQHVGLRNRHHL